MPRYFFHTADGGKDRDREGSELADHDAARLAAVRYAGALLRDQPQLPIEAKNFRVEVTDGAGALLFTVVTLVIDAPAAGD